MTYKVKVTNIKWDTDGEIIPELPDSTTLTIEDYDIDEDEDIDLIIGDMLSDLYGFCHFGFNYEFV